jgi:TolB-like protein
VSAIEEKETSATRTSAFWRMVDQLRKRKVCRTAISYMLVMWLNLQIGDVIFPMIGLPGWSLSLIIIIGIMGFPVVLILAWAFQVTPQGIVLDEGENPESPTYWKLDAFANLALLVTSIALSILLLLQFFAGNHVPLVSFLPDADTKAIVVRNLSFESATRAPANESIALRIREELRHRLINLDGIDMLPEESELDPDDDRRRLALAGSLLLDGSKAHVLAHLIDLSAGRYLMSTTFDLDVESALAAETTAAEKIVGEVANALQADQIAQAPSETPLRAPVDL